MTTVARRIHIPKTKPGLIGFDAGYHVNTSIHNRLVAIEEGGYESGAIIAMNGSGQEHEIAKVHKNGQIKLVTGGLCCPHDCKVVRRAQKSIE